MDRKSSPGLTLPTGCAAEDSAGSDTTPTLAAAPEGLSARRVERWLDLPPGAWQKRRLYALRLRGRSFAHLGFQPGDIVIVEPGAREQPGSVVVTRGSHGPSLRRMTRGSSAARRLPTVLELPLRERSDPRNERVVGTVIGHLRATGTGALRPIASAPSRSARKHRARREPAPSPSPQRSRLSVDSLQRTLALWTEWIAARGPSAAPAELESWDRLLASLTALCECLERTHNRNLRDALVAETAPLVATIHSVMGG